MPTIEVKRGMYSMKRLNCMKSSHFAIFLLTAMLGLPMIEAAEPVLQAPGVTSLTNQGVVYTEIETHYVKIQRGEVTAIIVDNAAIDIPALPKHRAGYNGVASLTHGKRDINLFVPGIAGLNFEHIHDGTTAALKEKFEPRKFPIQIRRVNDYTVELYQPPTGNWKLESCGRYTLLTDGTIEYTFECIPRGNDYAKGFIGLFWASYIHQPEEKAIHFLGRRQGTGDPTRWIKAVSPKHGVASTHPPNNYPWNIEIEDTFPLTLVGNQSPFEHTVPWYFGVSHGMALALMFRPEDRIWLAQSPSGGGNGNPAWDFQWFIPDVQIGCAYGFTMRASYLPFESRDQLIRATQKHRKALGHANAD